MCKIKFEIKKAGFIRIRVTNILGIELSSVVNNYEIPGKYEYEVDDESLMPSRYYYKIYDWNEPEAAQLNGNLNKYLLQSGPIIIGEGMPKQND